MKKLFSHHLVILGFILLVAAFLRFWELGSIPLGLNTDETAIGYNAYSISQTGKDEYGARYPLYFKSFGDNKLPVYIYSTAGVIKLLGPTPLAVRLTSTIFGMIAIVAIYGIVRLVSGNKTWAILAAFFLAINPWHIFFSRTGFEVNVAATLLLLGILFFLIWIKTKKWRIGFIFLSVLFFILSMYCYNATRVLSPFIFASLVGFFAITERRMSKKSFVLPIILFGLGMIPMASAFLNKTVTENQSSLLIFGGQSRADILEFRSYVNLKPAFLSQLLFNSWALYCWQFIKNIFSYLSVNFFFINGANHPINGLTNFGMFHLVELIFVSVGLLRGIKKKIFALYPFYIWIGLVIVLTSITRELPHPTRSYAVLFPLIIFSSYGFLLTIEFITKHKNTWLKRGLLFAVIGLLGYSVLLFSVSYFYSFPYKFAEDWRARDQELSQFIKNNEHDHQHIILDEEANFGYTSLLFHSQYPPQKLHESQEYGRNGLLTTLKKFGKYEYRKIDPEQDKRLKNALIITKPATVMDAVLVREIKLPTQKKVMFYDDQFVEIPEEEVIYKVYSTK